MNVQAFYDRRRDLNVHVENDAGTDAVHVRASCSSPSISCNTCRRRLIVLGGTGRLISSLRSQTQTTSRATFKSIPLTSSRTVPCSLPSTHVAATTPTRSVRSWRIVDRQAFQRAILDSKPGNPLPSGSADELFTLQYGDELRRLADEFAPVYGRRPSAVAMVRRRVQSDPSELPSTVTPVPSNED